MAMEHDLDNEMIVGEEGKKRVRGILRIVVRWKGEIGDCMESPICYRRLPRGKPTGRNKNIKLECPRFGESSDSSSTSALAEEILSPSDLLNGDQNKQKRMEKIRRSCGFHFGIDVDSIGSRGGLSLAWRGNVSIALQSFPNRHIDVIIGEEGDGEKWIFIDFYGSPYSYDREESWNLLQQLQNQGDNPWLVCGDFNEILYSFEKKGGLPREKRRMEAFRKALEDCSLVDLSYSDHCPLIDTDYRVKRIVEKRFKFEAWWILEETFLDETKSIWENSTEDLVKKLESLKRGLERNTAFFHKQASQRRKQNRIHKLQCEDGRKTEEWKDMEEIARSYFLRLFSTGGKNSFENILTGIRRCISEEDNIKLKARFTNEEIWEALSEMGPTKASGDDGFPALFYQKCWSIIGDDVSNFCLQRLKKGRLISDNVLLAYEILHTLKLKRVGKKGFMAIKLDMSKVYDRVEWGFAEGVMKKIGFDPGWVDLVLNCVSSVSYSVSFNGNIGQTFLPSRGLRQGDPLSPFLFLICREGFSSLMRLAKGDNVLKGVKASQRGPAISHLLFAVVFYLQKLLKGKHIHKNRYCKNTSQVPGNM
ncbi:uncharacterized protein LOC128040503 [Gossypium raimondii]|uniref:uncharacterized protein LOC128040503 n=1 Tax=Gossypium raimondii TaxID=29730 RepID=UPI00227CA42F|nr:uncharacterized protein LOC128040503 [Gossypium raimondii]